MLDFMLYAKQRYFANKSCVYLYAMRLQAEATKVEVMFIGENKILFSSQMFHGK